MSKSVVMIVPATHVATLNALAESMDYGPDNWNISLSPSGLAPATHFGTHLWEMEGSEFQGLRLAVQAGVTPPGLEAYAAALESIIIRVEDDFQDAGANWAAALTETGLKVIAG